MYDYTTDRPGLPPLDETVNVLAQRNGIPFYGVGLLAEIPESEILSKADPDDEDGDGISGRPNWDRGFAGRFGLKAQTVSIEGFLRGPMFNHLGITSDPLSEGQKGALPVDSSSRATSLYRPAVGGLHAFAQAAAPDGPLTDSDGVPDPEMTSEDLFALVSFAMLMAAPEMEPPSERSIRGAEIFDRIGCAACHTPRLNSPRGPLHVYSDLLLHDMGEELADGVEMGVATGSEFRTQPLWGLAATGPYLHDGRAETIGQATLLHGGESQESRDKAAELSERDFDDLVEFMLSLGGRNQYSSGMVPPGEGIPPVGEYGGPIRPLTPEEGLLYLKGREVFDRNFGNESGVGKPGLNADSCRGCHFDPVIGGAGPNDVNIIRVGRVDALGEFAAPSMGTLFHKVNTNPGELVLPEEPDAYYEQRQTPPTYGLGLVDKIAEEVIIANAAPDDRDGDGISGRVSHTPDGRVGRFGWKANIPSLAEFLRAAAAGQMGISLGYQHERTFGMTEDKDDYPDPELALEDAELLLFFMAMLGPPPDRGDPNDPVLRKGADVFERIGCAACHIPTLEGPSGPVPLYSDLLMHEILPPGYRGIGGAMEEFRTSPLWGIRDSPPYMHSGLAETLEEAIELHEGEGASSRDKYLGLDADELEALLAFLDSL
jgi:CxxC motif-containing protein (DUF1111 family)